MNFGAQRYTFLPRSGIVGSQCIHYVQLYQVQPVSQVQLSHIFANTWRCQSFPFYSGTHVSGICVTLVLFHWLLTGLNTSYMLTGLWVSSCEISVQLAFFFFWVSVFFTDLLVFKNILCWIYCVVRMYLMKKQLNIVQFTNSTLNYNLPVVNIAKLFFIVGIFCLNICLLKDHKNVLVFF